MLWGTNIGPLGSLHKGRACKHGTIQIEIMGSQSLVRHIENITIEKSVTISSLHII